MAAVTTQTECAPKGTRSPGSLLKLASHGDQTEMAESYSQFTGAAAVFAMPPDAALQQLCNNLDRLQTNSAKVPTESNSPSISPLGDETPIEADSAVPAVALHYGDSEHASDRSPEEAFQLAILSRKFLSKNVPPIPIKEYLVRLHRYCPMSTAVFLATSVYITKMILVDKVLRLTPKNMHRLVLAGLLVATKALEDLGFPHSRVAKVGGVSEQELSKLEISFCFLANFELRVDAQMLMDEIKELQCNRDSECHDNKSSPP